MGRHRRASAVIIIGVAAALGLSGCVSLADRAGIASKKYADEQAARAVQEASATSKEQLEARIAELQADLQAVRQDAEAMKKAMETINEVVSSVSQMEELAKAFEERLAGLPEETLRKLVQILSEYLGQGK